MLQEKPSCLAPCSQNDQHAASCRYQKSELNKRPQKLSKRKTKIGSDLDRIRQPRQRSCLCPRCKSPYRLSTPYKSCIWLPLTWRQQKEQNSNRFPLTVVKAVAELYWWRLGKLMVLQRGQQFWLLFHLQVLIPDTIQCCYSSLCSSERTQGQQWYQVNTEGHCSWAAAGLRLCPSSVISHHNPVVTLRKNLFTRNLPNNALETWKCLSFTLLNNNGVNVFVDKVINSCYIKPQNKSWSTKVIYQSWLQFPIQ